MKRALVCGAGGFIGNYLVKRLKNEGSWVRGADLKYPKYSESKADEFVIVDLRNQELCQNVLDQPFDEVYQFAADMGGAGFIFTGDNDADVMHNSVAINVNMVNLCHKMKVKKLLYSSSACVYPEYNQLDPDNPKCSEDSTYPAAPDSDYGWEKLFSERLYLAYHKNHGLEVRIARLHNIFGPESAWNNGREKAPAALCRKVAEAENNGFIEVWGDGKQTRSFLYIDECLEGMLKLMQSDFTGPVNIGSEEMISINALSKMIIKISGKNLSIKNIPGPQGVRGRNSDNRLIKEKLGWEPSMALVEGMTKTYQWVNGQVKTKVPFDKICKI